MYAKLFYTSRYFSIMNFLHGTKGVINAMLSDGKSVKKAERRTKNYRMILFYVTLEAEGTRGAPAGIAWMKFSV